MRSSVRRTVYVLSRGWVIMLTLFCSGVRNDGLGVYVHIQPSV